METVGCFEKCKHCPSYIWKDENQNHWYFTIMGQYSFKRIILKLSFFKKYSSARQRGYFHAVIVEAYSQASGLDKESAYESLMTYFYPIEYKDPISGAIKTRRKSYLSLTTSEAEELHANARTLLNEQYGLILPLPNEPWGVYG